MTLTSVLLDTPSSVAARLGWDPGTSVHDRRRILAKELIAARLGCDMTEIRIEREAPRGFGYHTRLIASRDGQELPIAIVTASYRAATVVAISQRMPERRRRTSASSTPVTTGADPRATTVPTATPLSPVPVKNVGW